ncbi:phosphotransferase enzyme family protein [Bartonella tamiae]|uniref:Aminoglycoside phosphotransferase domain-containing protein n=1 Tax=Bartonella tamiae Th239 TaxID=1094558 RepID=J1K381_9HYPH|nr:phosphotransferase [Bartonella tamiae]EJF91580.1 hypothetical protein ME5_00275 [Bartonella tamiae Th239]EJF92436.1 hypothetical protein MEG_01606 [Bartonella tamiae Th307]
MIEHFKTLIRSQLSLWRLDCNARIDLLAISENTTFVIEHYSRRYILRIYRKDYQTDAEIFSELSWLEEISKNHVIKVPQIIKTITDSFFVHCEDYRLACFSFIDGYEPRVDENLPTRFVQLGEISAKLHDHSLAWQRPKRFRRKHWTYQTMIGPKAYWGDWRKNSCLSNRHYDILHRCDDILKNTMENVPRHDSDYGLIHADLRLANLLVLEDRLSVIDFDDCGFSWFGLDLANGLSFIEHHSSVPNLIDAWFKGYERIRPITQIMRNIVPHLIMMRRLQLTAWLANQGKASSHFFDAKEFTDKTVQLAEAYIKTYFS